MVSATRKLDCQGDLGRTAREDWRQGEVVSPEEGREWVGNLRWAMAAGGYGPQGLFKMRQVLEEVFEELLGARSRGTTSDRLVVRYQVNGEKVVAEVYEGKTGP